MPAHSERTRWLILSLVILTNMLVIAIPQMGMSVLAQEIARDLKLNLVQVGIVWGIGSLPGIVTSLLGGMIGDSIGPKRVLIVAVLLGGVLGMARGLADSFLALTLIMILGGAVTPAVLMNTIKTLGEWFPPQELGLANGLQSMGMALGFMIGALFSATTLSPGLGGWRNVLVAYGVLGALLSLAWLVTPVSAKRSGATGAPLSLGTALRHVAGLKNIWLLALGLLGFSGAVQGALGFLPLYLRGAGWPPLQADGALSAFHTISLMGVIPLVLLANRLGSRKRFLLITGLMSAVGIGLLSFAGGGWVWVAVLLAGSVRDAFMALFLTAVIEAEGVGPVYAGTATGFTMALSGLGSAIAPPIGNSLAGLWPGAPFAFWSALSGLGLMCLALMKASRPDRNNRDLEIVAVPAGH